MIGLAVRLFARLPMPWRAVVRLEWALAAVVAIQAAVCERLRIEEKVNERRLSWMEVALDQYARDYGALPNTLQELTLVVPGLITRPAGLHSGQRVFGYSRWGPRCGTLFYVSPFFLWVATPSWYDVPRPPLHRCD